MAADKVHRVAKLGLGRCDDAPFGAPYVGDEGPRLGEPTHFRNQRENPLNRGADKDQIGSLEGALQLVVAPSFVDRAEFEGAGDGCRAADAHEPPAKAGAPERQAHGATNQAHADDDYPPEEDEGSSRSRSKSVVRLMSSQ